MCFIQGQWQFEEIYEYKPWQGKKTVCPLQRPLAIDSTPAWLSMSNLRVVAASAGHGPEAERCHFCELIKLSKKKGYLSRFKKTDCNMYSYTCPPMLQHSMSFLPSEFCAQQSSPNVIPSSWVRIISSQHSAFQQWMTSSFWPVCRYIENLSIIILMFASSFDAFCLLWHPNTSRFHSLRSTSQNHHGKAPHQ